MKKFVLAAAFAVSTFALAGVASANVGAGLVGNTVTLTGPDGAVTKIYYPDATSIVVQGADGTESQGTWRVSDNTICTTVAGKLHRPDRGSPRRRQLRRHRRRTGQCRVDGQRREGLLSRFSAVPLRPQRLKSRHRNTAISGEREWDGYRESRQS